MQLKIKKNVIEIEELEKVFADENCIPATFASSDVFAPYLGTTLQSIVEHTDAYFNYDFVIFSKDMSDFNKTLLKDICSRPNISLRFVNVEEIFSGLSLYAPAHLTIETYFRLVIPAYMGKYDKILFLDSDLIVLDDIKKLYNYDISDYALAGTEECLMSALLGICGEEAVKYMYEVLKLKNPDKYLQAGVLLINNNYFRENNCCETLMHMVSTFEYNILDQDAINELLNDKVLWLPNEWNYPPLQKHMKKEKYIENMSEFIREKYLGVKEPKIVHYADREKPWFYPTEDYAPLWWSYNRKTPFYEECLRRMCTKEYSKDLIRDIVNYRIIILKYWKYKFGVNFVFGKMRERYSRKKVDYKKKITTVRRFMRNES